VGAVADPQSAGWSSAIAATEIKINATIFALAIGFIAAGLILFFWGVRRRNLPYVRTTNPLVWALVAMGPALLLFSIFPDSTAEGTLGAFTVGGAFAAFALVWWLGTRLGLAGIEADAGEERLRAETVAATRAHAIAAPAASNPVLQEQHDLRYAVRGCKGKELVILTGDLIHVRDVDVWVSPENTNMQPSRYHERSISAMIRYFGAGRDDGDPCDDVIGDALATAMAARSRSVVPAHTVIATGSGALAATNGVKRIYHVAAVQGIPGGGYEPVAQIGRCATNALQRMDHPDEAAYGARTIILPLLASGTAGGDAGQIASELVATSAAYLKSTPGTRARTVYLLAYRLSELHHWRSGAEASSLLECRGGSAESLLS
jgi:hypothetical protein